MAGSTEVTGPDLENDGAAVSDLSSGDMLLGHVGDAAVVLVRTDSDVYAIGGRCTHYGGPLGKGIFDGVTVRCPWHHARFDPVTGAAVAAPALNPVPTFAVEERNGRFYVVGEGDSTSAPAPITEPPESVVILGAGPAGAAAAETLRAEGYEGPITMVGAEDTVPIDRPNLSKDYLAGSAPEEWMPLRGESFYEDRDIELRLGSRVAGIDTARRVLELVDGGEIPYGALLLATGADPIHLDLEGADRTRVHYLRTLSDSRAIIADTAEASTVAIIGASFIGLEVAASLRSRGLDVHIVAPEEVPMARILGDELGSFVKSLHEEHGVVFHLGTTATSVDQAGLLLSDGTSIPADLVVVGVGVRPATALAEQAGLEVDRGVVTDEELRTSDPRVWAAGDIARYPDERFGGPIRVEHFVVAERQGQAAARNIIGRGRPYREVPFFWSQHYDVQLNYVGHAEGWDEVVIDGSIEDRDATIQLVQDGSTRAVVTVWRDRASLLAEVAMERGDLGPYDDLPPQ